MKFEKLKPGMVVFDVHSYRMGNTTMTSMGCWRIYIESVDAEKRTVQARWNGNPAKRYSEYEIKKWREKEPLMVKSGIGCSRLATREEIKAHKEKQNGPD